MKKTDFVIVPIFNPLADTGVLRRFCDIEMNCDAIKYHYDVDETDFDRVYQSHQYDFAHRKNNFAFGAYAGEKMLGFASGYLSGVNEMYLRNLYVEPKYSGRGIGGMLLRNAENAASVVASNMSVVSLGGAVGFYEMHGYTNYDNRNMVKILQKNIVGVVPVFKWQYKLNRKLDFDVDTDSLKNLKNQPMFAYMGPNGKIKGVAFRDVDGQNRVVVQESGGGAMPDFYAQQLLRAISRAR